MDTTITSAPIGSLRQRMLQDMKLRGLTPLPSAVFDDGSNDALDEGFAREWRLRVSAP